MDKNLFTQARVNLDSQRGWHYLRVSPTQDFILRGAKPQNEDLKIDYSNHESSRKSLKKNFCIIVLHINQSY